jgi:hypothetical protein
MVATDDATLPSGMTSENILREVWGCELVHGFIAESCWNSSQRDDDGHRQDYCLVRQRGPPVSIIIAAKNLDLGQVKA